MKKRVLVDLIKSHYEGDRNTFFHNAMEVLKEFKDDGDEELVNYLEFVMLPHIKLMPKIEIDNSVHEIYPDGCYGWFVPQSEESDILTCPKCGSHNIASNKDISDPWIKCLDCGHVLRKRKSVFGTTVHPIKDPIKDEPKNGGYVAVDVTRDGTVIFRNTDDPKDAVDTKTLHKIFK